MISLTPPKEPYDLELPYNVVVTVKPLTSAGMSLCQAAARKRLNREYPDLDDEIERDGHYQVMLVQELACAHITAWQGVADDSGEQDAPVTKENIKALLDLYPMGERFFQAFTLHQVMLNAAKNASGPSADGISNKAAGQPIAEDVEKMEPPAPEVSLG
ncbi:hypothetical protein [Magnetococcus sp. PR-3]|uniref:hypothetical protein n=1 Tax=Magnetococcus sp. PR-3 TaxID=3120355 RepID=UPI002FCDE8C1